MKHQFRSRKEVSVYLSTKGIDTSNWTEEKWLQINKGQAEIHMMALAEAMWDAYNESTPKELKAGEWHIPFGDKINIKLANDATKEMLLRTDLSTWTEKQYTEFCIKIATARCARVSYTVVGEEGKPDNYENDIKLHDRLAASGHWSPFEHCAKAMNEEEYFQDDRGIGLSDKYAGWSGNFRGFVQYRKMIPNENITK